MLLHKTGSSELTHKTLNPFSMEKRQLFFFSDPPHLIKTARNCLALTKRSLWVCIGVILLCIFYNNVSVNQLLLNISAMERISLGII